MAVIGNALRAVHQALDDEKRKIAEEMAAGRMSSYEHYKEQVGFVKGLARAQQVVKDTMKRVHENEEE